MAALSVHAEIRQQALRGVLSIMEQTKTENLSANRRIPAIDYLRGAALIYMVCYHILFDLAFVIPTEWGKAAYYANENIVIFDTSSFILLAGISCAFSRSNLRRGGRLLPIAMAFTAVTAFFFPGEAIYFGILHLMSVGMVLYGAFDSFFKKLPAALMIPLCAVIFTLTYYVSNGFVGIKGWFELPLPQELLTNNLLYPFGFIKGGFMSVDYVPLLPWLFLFLGGAYIGGLIVKYREKLPAFCFADPLPWLGFIGRHTLIVYVLHQPIILAVLYAVEFIFGS